MTLQALDYLSEQGNTISAPPKRFDYLSEQENTISAPPKRFVSETDYWKKYYDDPVVTYEWNNGYLEEISMSDILTMEMYKCFLELLEHYLKTHPIAKSVLLETGFRLAFAQTVEIRRPDLGVVLNSNPVVLKPEDKSYGGIFDLCVEAISDSSKEILKRDTEVKKREYAASGVKEYYILDGYDRYTAFYCLNAQGIYEPIKTAKGGIIKSTVLPGFQFRIENLYHRLSLEEMVKDPVYQGFVLPGYQEERRARQEAEQQVKVEALARIQAEQQAEMEALARIQAEQQVAVETLARIQAEQRVERFAEQLRMLGINPDDI